MSVFEAVKLMTKDEFTAFCNSLYTKGREDGMNLLDDGPWIRQRLADWPFEQLGDME